MIDIKLIRNNPEKVRQSIKNRGGRYLPVFEEILLKDGKYKEYVVKINELRTKRNEISQKIASYKIKGEQVPQDLLAESNNIKQELNDIEKKSSELEKELNFLLLSIPNILDEKVPIGNSEQDNKVVYERLEFKREFDFKPLDHHQIGEKLGIFDFERAAKISGSRFAMLKGQGARLERALIQFMLDVQTLEHGYTEILPPFLVNEATMTGTGQLPKFEEELYKTNTQPPLYLIPTAEVPLTNIYANEILNEKDLPIKLTAWTACFRQEAGTYGKDTRGLIRNHQFNKIELVWITTPQQSEDALFTMRGHAEKILQLLKIPYRVVELCSYDTGFSSSMTFDLEVWFPSENRFREISSCSNCKDFQARRMNLRFRNSSGKLEYVHTLNGSGIAVGRAFAAILENYQQKDGSVVIPEVLRKYTGFDKIG